MNILLITNNILVYKKYREIMDIIFKEDSSYLDILYYTRDLIHKGHELLTHPLSGSIKPNETPFKTIILSKERGNLDFQYLEIIEKSIQSTEKFISNKATPNWSERVLEDFRVIDLSLIENIIDLKT
ncbi:MAG TPA: GrdX family protein [Tissierellaceae bacterium]|nr:GrdX family protein [Tissierellaceae bacterium]